MLNYYDTKLGEMIAHNQDGTTCKVEIRDANCFCAMIGVYEAEGKWYHQPWLYFNTATELRRELKKYGKEIFDLEVSDIKMNYSNGKGKRMGKMLKDAGFDVEYYVSLK